MERRKEELEKKRQKLAELRRAREERIVATTKVQQPPLIPLSNNNTTAGQAPTAERSRRNDRNEVDELVNSLLNKNDKEKSETPVTNTSPGDSDNGSDKGGSSYAPSYVQKPVLGQLSSPVSSMPQSPAIPSARFIPDFTHFETIILDIAPKEKVFYGKEVQTTATSFGPQPPSENEIYEKVKAEFEAEEKARKEEEEKKRKEELDKQKKVQLAKDLNDKERDKIIHSVEFTKFIDYSTKVALRALNETYDIITNYSESADLDSGDEDSLSRVKLVCTFFDDKWSKNRSVTDVCWSRKCPELSIASYNKNPMSMNEPDGIVLVWNIHLLERPEFVFHSQSDVLTTTYSNFNPNLIIGGTYSGQIVLWDTRAKSLPVLKTPLSSAGHTHPVYSMQMVGTQNAHNLVSASTDGLICSWQLDMLAQPQETLELVHPTHAKTDEVSVTALGFPDNETTAFWVGTEEGDVYQANRFDRAGSKAGINQYDYYRGHWGPVTGLQFHPLVGQVDFSDLFLTSSVDWTVKLWRSKSISKPANAKNIISSLHSFEGADDYVYDVKWSPNHPALFASVDGTGKFALWNLNSDTEIPVVSTQVGGGRALNKLNWDKDGRRVAIGASDGRVHVYDIGEMSHPRPDESATLQKIISEMISNTESDTGRYAAISHFYLDKSA
ncbi:6210_t:CDS:10 [Ambispora gerdemannii]|uniref:6210_t:CDS:1 n=1 Tax=Ambispora gerdemannii TaxID=144530 RepID=A0A9N8V3T4_9GLOM|nr:6210_t:CDS:10 [Ambispora gerdemannii]